MGYANGSQASETYFCFTRKLLQLSDIILWASVTFNIGLANTQIDNE